MSYRDIVNRDIVNLQNCEEEPIHIPGAIQPHGFLLAVDKDSGHIAFCSGNVQDFLGRGYDELIGKSPADLFDPAFVSHIANTADTELRETQLDFGDRRFAVTTHAHGNNIIIEGEPVSATPLADSGLYSSSRNMLRLIEDSFTLKQLCSAVAVSIKDITGYDRVMIYRFDAEYNGEVIAESKEEHLESFLGLHYPHTDIPPQARALYLVNQLRVIVDVNYTPVPIFTAGKVQHDALNLSHSVLRSVSPIHIEYLQNMGVGATLTISLIHKNKLWGLIACHHYSPKHLSPGERIAAKLYGHIITSQIDARILREEYDDVKLAQQACRELTSMELDTTINSIQQIVKNDHALQLCHAAGIAVLIDDAVYTYGQTPAPAAIPDIARQLFRLTNCDDYHTTQALKDLPGIEEVLADFPGIVYKCIHKGSLNSVIWFRKETVTEVKWAGDPDKAIEKDKSGLSPRKSFTLWKETVKGKSKPWLDYELKECNDFFHFLTNHYRAITLYEEQMKQQRMNKMLKDVNDELERINWISTHDLQEPLRKIRMMSSFVTTTALTDNRDNVLQWIKKIDASAQRMQDLIGDILTFSNLKKEDKAEDVDLNKILAEVLKEHQPDMEQGTASISVQQLPHIKGYPFMLRQLFQNLVTNALKFADPSRRAEIVVSAAPADDGGVVVAVADNGIGFEDQYKHRIFDIFARLHNKEDFEGTGIGLALCRKIMEKHNGSIWAEGRPGEGATFYTWFPQG